MAEGLVQGPLRGWESKPWRFLSWSLSSLSGKRPVWEELCQKLGPGSAAWSAACLPSTEPRGRGRRGGVTSGW